jgi:large subunit ribosomal protein L21
MAGAFQDDEDQGTMFAVVRTGGKQYRVAADDEIVVEKLDGDAGSQVKLDVLMLADSDGLKDAAKAVVTAEIVGHNKGDKVIIFKKKRRHNYRRKNGHRQHQTVLKILSIA